MKLTREDFEKVVEKNNIRNEKNKRLGDLFGKHLIYVFIAEAVIICFLPIKLMLKIFVWIIAVAFTAIVVPLIMSTIIFLGSLKGLSPGILTKLHFGTKYRKSIEKFRNDLCSDRVLSFVEKLIEREKNRFSRIALLDQKRLVHNLRCENEAAYRCIEELRLENEKCGEKFRDTVLLAELSYYGTVDDAERFISIFDANEAEIADMLERDAVEICSVGSLLAAYETYKGNYRQALEYICLSAEYREKIRTQTYGNKPEDNMDVYSKSASHAMRARIYAMLGEIENAELHLKTAKEFADELTCEIPMLLAEEFAEAEMKIFQKNRKQSENSCI